MPSQESKSSAPSSKSSQAPVSATPSFVAPLIRTSVFAEPSLSKSSPNSRSPAKGDNNPSALWRRSTTSLTATGTPCGKCGIPVLGEHTIALGKSWHPEHFSCGSCDKPLVGDFFDHEGVINCKECAEKTFRCSKCDTLIAGEYFMLKGKRFHTTCADFSLCFVCREVINGSEMIAISKHYHPQCFRCSDCATVIASKFYNREGQPVCDDCMNRVEAAKRKKCDRCSNPVTGAYVAYEGRSFHDECFKCAECLKLLPIDDFYSVNGNPSCFDCASRSR